MARLVPGVPALSEERVHPAKPPYRGSFFLIDPLDGTTNFAHGLPAYCVSIGVECDGRGIIGVVYDPTRADNEALSARYAR